MTVLGYVPTDNIFAHPVNSMRSVGRNTDAEFGSPIFFVLSTYLYIFIALLRQSRRTAEDVRREENVL